MGIAITAPAWLQAWSPPHINPQQVSLCPLVFETLWVKNLTFNCTVLLVGHHDFHGCAWLKSSSLQLPSIPPFSYSKRIKWFSVLLLTSFSYICILLWWPHLLSFSARLNSRRHQPFHTCLPSSQSLLQINVRHVSLSVRCVTHPEIGNIIKHNSCRIYHKAIVPLTALLESGKLSNVNQSYCR